MRYKPCRNPTCREKIAIESTKQFCSKNCRMRYYRSQGAVPQFKRRPIRSGHCLCCNTEFTTTQPKRKFCSVSCRVNYFQQMKRLDKKGSL